MAWRTFLALGLGSVLAAACTAKVEVNGTVNDGGPDSGNTGGANTGGGNNTGGSKGGSGGSATGGGSNTGGANGGSGGDSGGPTTCDPASAPDDCTKCVEEHCCQDYNDCQNDRCAGTNATGSDGELFCMIDCLTKGVSGLDGGGASRSDCSDKCKGSHAVLDPQTQAVITCMTAQASDASTAQVCGVRCFGADVP